jgi:hypothetical protein
VQAGGASCACDSGFHASGTACISDGGVFGMNIPAGHPRLLFNATNLPAAQAWYTANPFDPRSDDPMGQALKGLLANDAASCAAAVTWAKAESAGMRVDGTACDDCRWSGETIIVTYDWCYGLMSDADRTALETTTDAWIDHWRTQSWGGVPMHENNYYWGYTRNEFEWGVVRYDANPTFATTQLDDALNVRLANDFYPATDAVGGVGQEGAQYGPYVLGYATIPLVSAGQMGRDMFGESNYFLAGIYAYIYETAPSGDLFTWNDNDGYAPSSSNDAFIADFMTASALNWKASPAGGHARKWLATTGAQPDLHITVIDDGSPAAGDLSSLPLDYYAAGPSYLFGRSSWSATASAYMLSLGAEHGVGHNHEDYGGFQLARGGVWLSRESVGYGGSGIDLVGLGGSGTGDVRTAIAHNTVAVGSALPADGGDPVIRRLESQAGYSFANVDLSPVFASGHVERDFVWVRKLEALVIYDRGANVFLAHCETVPVTSGNTSTCTNGAHKLVLTSLVGSPSFGVVTEGSMSGQSRVEVGVSGTEMVTVLQALDASGTPFVPSLVDNGSSYTVTLDGTVSMSLAKGTSSSGGSITIDGTTTSFRSDVQPMTVTASGPAWQ